MVSISWYPKQTCRLVISKIINTIFICQMYLYCSYIPCDCAAKTQSEAKLCNTYFSVSTVQRPSLALSSFTGCWAAAVFIGCRSMASLLLRGAVILAHRSRGGMQVSFYPCTVMSSLGGVVGFIALFTSML